jgi:integrase
VLPVIGQRQIREVEKFEIDVLVKRNAETFSGSMVQKIRIYVKATMEEVIDQGLLDRNPARKVIRPPTRATCKRFLSLDEITRLLDAMEGRDRLVARIRIVLGLRPGEVFATKWDDFDDTGGRLRIDESAVDSQIKDTKTPDFRAWLWLPKSMTGELTKWRATSSTTLIFPSIGARPISTRNFLRCHIWPAAVRAGIMQPKPKGWPKGKQWVDPATSVNFRAFRRTCATWFQKVGTTIRRRSCAGPGPRFHILRYLQPQQSRLHRQLAGDREDPHCDRPARAHRRVPLRDVGQRRGAGCKQAASQEARGVWRELHRRRPSASPSPVRGLATVLPEMDRRKVLDTIRYIAFPSRKYSRRQGGYSKRNSRAVIFSVFAPCRWDDIPVR